MKKVLIGLIVGLLATTMAHASGGDAASGKSKAVACGACHGADGNSMVPSFPKLAGQNERYLIKQMNNIVCGALSADEQKAQKCSGRWVPTMAGQLDNSSAEDIADIAAYYASQQSSGGQTKAALAAKGEEIYRAGIGSKSVPACSACHSPTGKGNGPAGFPALSGQHSDYIAAQLRAFRAAADGLEGRSNDGDSKIMRDIAYRMSDSEIDAVASYINGLH